jgi:hypothetical protein
MEPVRTRGILAVAAVLLLGSLTPGVANADSPPNPNCWGVVTSQLAGSSTGAVGEHASDPPPPPEPLDRPGRGGIANSPFGHPSNLGSFLATIDGVEETQCP